MYRVPQQHLSISMTPLPLAAFRRVSLRPCHVWQSQNLNQPVCGRKSAEDHSTQGHHDAGSSQSAAASLARLRAPGLGLA
eukprot:2698088-Rhodomonas_salina.1